MRRTAFILFLLMSVFPALSQNRVTVSGYISDALSGETLIGATVIETGSALGAVSNNYGFYSFSLPQGEYELVWSFVGYNDEHRTLKLTKDLFLNIGLTPGETLASANIVAEQEAGIRSPYPGSIDLPLPQIKTTPLLFGESDILKSLQLMPGVQGSVEGFTGLHVRGGGPDENLVLLDGAPIYNLDHLFGLFSIFQTEAVKKVTIYKGAFPARYGGRASSIVDIRTNDGNMKGTHGSVTIGSISDKLHIEGPIVKDRLAWSVNARGMHSVLFAPLIKAVLKNWYVNYYFYDTSAKLTWHISDRDRLYFGVYHGRDRFDFDYDSSTDLKELDLHYAQEYGATANWGNTVGTVRWSHVFNSRLFCNSTIAFNQYDMLMNGIVSSDWSIVGSGGGDYHDIQYRSGIRDWSAKTDFDWTPAPDHQVRFGAEYIFHRFRPKRISTLKKATENGKVTDEDLFYFTDPDFMYRGHDAAVYAEDTWSIGRHLSLNPGVRLTMFNTQGTTYWSLQPRFNAKVATEANVLFKVGYARMAQYVHLLSTGQISLPVDLWIPITRDIKPVISDQLSAGVYYDGLKGWEFSVEGYYKYLRNILEYKDGTLLLGGSEGWESEVETGIGRTMGVELLILKKTGRVTGSLAYTLAKSERRFPDGSINNGEWFPYKYDRRHSIDVNVNYRINTRWDLSALWSYATGGAVTVPSRKIAVIAPDGTVHRADYIESRNNFRLPPSHHLNLGVNYHIDCRVGETVWNFSVYNVYNRMNPNFVWMRSGTTTDETGTSSNVAKMTRITVLPFLPSFSVTRTF